MSRIIKASEFKAKCLAILDEVERTRQPVVITKRGKPCSRTRAAYGEAKCSGYFEGAG